MMYIIQQCNPLSYSTPESYAYRLLHSDIDLLAAPRSGNILDRRVVNFDSCICISYRACNFLFLLQPQAARYSDGEHEAPKLFVSC